MATDSDRSDASPDAALDAALRNALADAAGPEAPDRLAAAIRHAVFPGGARIRPRLCLAVASACGAAPAVALPAAVAIELLHCASLVHDDLPCFDDAPLRRGRMSVQRAFGAPLAVLAGDALIVLAFEAMAAAAQPAAMIVRLAAAAGSPTGLVAGQAWEGERGEVSLATYQRAKTAALFAAATELGARAAGSTAAPEAWRIVGDRLGEAYQVADDLRDVLGSDATLGKPAGRDRALSRPSAVGRHGVAGARARLDRLIAESRRAIPSCPGHAALRALIEGEVERLLPDGMLTLAA